MCKERDDERDEVARKGRDEKERQRREGYEERQDRGRECVSVCLCWLGVSQAEKEGERGHLVTVVCRLWPSFFASFARAPTCTRMDAKAGCHPACLLVFLLSRSPRRPSTRSFNHSFTRHASTLIYALAQSGLRVKDRRRVLSRVRGNHCAPFFLLSDETVFRVDWNENFTFSEI